MTTRRRATLITLALLAGLVSAPILLTWREVRRAQLDRQLVQAVHDVNVARTQECLASGADPNENNDTAIELLLLKHGAEPDDSSHLSEYTPLMYATMNANETLVKALLDKHANVNRRDANDLTALAHARHRRAWKIVALLKHAGARE